jgi:hypothetical protein
MIGTTRLGARVTAGGRALVKLSWCDIAPRSATEPHVMIAAPECCFTVVIRPRVDDARTSAVHQIRSRSCSVWATSAKLIAIQITVMESILADLIAALQTAFSRLDAVDLDAILHDTENLPDKQSTSLASGALDLLESLRLRLEPRQLILADHFMGIVDSRSTNRCIH